jgi:hypothetical protein
MILAKPHICGLMGDDTARRLAERLDALERRIQLLEMDQSQSERDRRSPSAHGSVTALDHVASSKGQSPMDSAQLKTIGRRGPPNVSFDDAARP